MNIKGCDRNFHICFMILKIKCQSPTYIAPFILGAGAIQNYNCKGLLFDVKNY